MRHRLDAQSAIWQIYWNDGRRGSRTRLRRELEDDDPPETPPPLPTPASDLPVTNSRQVAGISVLLPSWTTSTTLLIRQEAGHLPRPAGHREDLRCAGPREASRGVGGVVLRSRSSTRPTPTRTSCAGLSARTGERATRIRVEGRAIAAGRQACAGGRQTRNVKHFLIIDEINRGKPRQVCSESCTSCWSTAIRRSPFNTRGTRRRKQVLPTLQPLHHWDDEHG